MLAVAVRRAARRQSEGEMRRKHLNDMQVPRQIQLGDTKMPRA